MATQTKTMRLKDFWQEVESCLGHLSEDDLRILVRSVIRDLPSSARPAFLQKLHAVETKVGLPPDSAFNRAELLDNVDSLLRKINATIDLAWNIDDGTEMDDGFATGIWENRVDGLDHYKEFNQPIADTFDQVDLACDAGEMALARQAYEKLSRLWSIQDIYGRRIGLIALQGLDLTESAKRYLRTIYETETPERRPRALLEKLRQLRQWYSRGQPMLRDLIEVYPQPLPQADQFFPDWIKLLAGETISDADAWLREAVRMMAGEKGIAQLARSEGARRPYFYLEWITDLKKSGTAEDVLEAAREALRAIPQNLVVRAEIADHLAAAALELSERDVMLDAMWESFSNLPSVDRLLDLWDYTTPPARSQAMCRAVTVLRRFPLELKQTSTGTGEYASADDQRRTAKVTKALLAHALLLAGNLEEARQLAGGEVVLGWSGSNNPQGVVVTFFMVLLSGCPPDQLPPHLQVQWKWALASSSETRSGTGFDERTRTLARRLDRTYATLLVGLTPDPQLRESAWGWCLDVAAKRVASILNKQYHQSYDKAAILTLACAELLRLHQGWEGACCLLDGIRSRFHQHRHFLAELEEGVRRIEAYFSTTLASR